MKEAANGGGLTVVTAAACSSVIVGAMSAALVEARASMTGPYRRL